MQQPAAFYDQVARWLGAFKVILETKSQKRLREWNSYRDWMMQKNWHRRGEKNSKKQFRIGFWQAFGMLALRDW